MSNNVPKDLTDTMNLMESLVEDLNGPTREIDESTFKRVFLPLLTSTEEVDLRAWVAIAGSPNGRVSVYRINKGVKEVLYVVPPLMNLNGFTKSNYQHQNSMWERIQNAMRRIRNAPMRAQQIYDEEIAQADIDGVKMPLKDALDWNRILTLNGIDTGLGLPAEVGGTNDKKTIQTDGWEDF